MESDETFGPWLKRHRKRLGLTQAKLADKIGYAAETVRKVEAGESLSPTFALKLGEALGIPSDHLSAFVEFARRGVTTVEHVRLFDKAVEGRGAPDLPPPPPLVGPPEADMFIGRQAEMADYVQSLTRDGVAIVVGMPGVGKTALAAALARRISTVDKVFWHTFHSGEGADVATWQLAAFLAAHDQTELWHLLQSAERVGRPPPPSPVLFDYVCQALPDHGYVLCFDEFHWVDTDALLDQLLGRLRLLAGRGAFKLIVASRQLPPWGRAAEVELLQGLSLEDTRQWLAAHGLNLADDLLPNLHASTEGNAQFLTLALDGLRQTPDSARLITRLSAVADIERYLMTEVDKRLGEAARRVMGAVAVLHGDPCTRDSVEYVLDTGGVGRILSDLSYRHLLTRRDGERGVEYGEHAMVRAFYYDLLGRRDRVSLHRQAGQFFETEEADSVRAARHYLAGGEKERAARLVSDSVLGAINRGQGQALRGVLESFRAPDLAPADWIRLNLARGEVYSYLREMPSARASYEAALAVLKTQPDGPEARRQTARAYRGLGSLLEHEAPREALTWLQRGLEAASDDPLETGLLYHRLGTVLIGLGEYPEAQQALERSLSLVPAEATDAQTDVLMNLGVVRCALGDYAQGQDYYERALARYEQTENYWMMVGLWKNLGMIREIAGDWDGAATEYAKALDWAQRLGNGVRQTGLELTLGILQMNRGDDQGALAHLTTCLRLARDHHLTEYAVGALSSLADLYLRQGQVSRAVLALQEAERLALAMDSRYQLPGIYRGWARAYRLKGEDASALSYAEQALTLARELGADIEVGMGLRVLGQVQVAGGQLAAALEVFAESLSILADQDPYEAARTQLDWGQALAPLAAPNGVRLLQEARAVFKRLGARRDLTAVNAALTSATRQAG